MPNGYHLRTAVWEQLFDEQAQAIQPDVRRLDDAERYLEMQVCARPEIGGATDYPGVLRAPLKLPRADGKLVKTTVFYMYDDDYVYFLSIRLVPRSYWAQPEDPGA